MKKVTMTKAKTDALKSIHKNITILYALTQSAVTSALSNPNEAGNAIFAISLIAEDMENAKEELEELIYS